MNRSTFTTKLCATALLLALLASLFCLPIATAENDGTLIAYQVTDGADGTFSLRLIAGVDSLAYESFGYEIKLTTKDESGNEVTETLTGETKQVYSSIWGGGNEYSAKETFGYEYAALATVTGLDVDSTYLKIEACAYLVLAGGNVKRGADVTLTYTGESDEQGYPILSDAQKPTDTPDTPDVPDEPKTYTALASAASTSEIATIDWSALKN